MSRESSAAIVTMTAEDVGKILQDSDVTVSRYLAQQLSIDNEREGAVNNWPDSPSSPNSTSSWVPNKITAAELHRSTDFCSPRHWASSSKAVRVEQPRRWVDYNVDDFIPVNPFEQVETSSGSPQAQVVSVPSPTRITVGDIDALSFRENTREGTLREHVERARERARRDIDEVEPEKNLAQIRTMSRGDIDDLAFKFKPADWKVSGNLWGDALSNTFRIGSLTCCGGITGVIPAEWSRIHDDSCGGRENTLEVVGYIPAESEGAIAVPVELFLPRHLTDPSVADEANQGAEGREGMTAAIPVSSQEALPFIPSSFMPELSDATPLWVEDIGANEGSELIIPPSITVASV